MEHYLKRLQEATRKYWDKSALNTWQGEGFTYGQVATSIERYHIFFRDAGFSKGEHFALCGKNGAHWGMTYLAINTYEAVVVPILNDFTSESVENLTDHSDSVILFTDEAKWKTLEISRMPKLRLVFDFETLRILWCKDSSISAAYASLDKAFSEKWPDGYGPNDVAFPVDNWDDLAVINYTSGSTGNPKGVMLTYRNFSANVDYSQRNVPSSDKFRMVSMLPMAHMYGLVIEFIYPLCNGTAIYWLGKAPTPTTLLKCMADVKPYLLITVPLVMEKIFKSKIEPVVNKPLMKAATSIPGIKSLVFKKIREGLVNAFGGEVQQFIMGGAALNPEVEGWFKKIKLPYLVGYGMTEACPLLAYKHWTKYVAGSCGEPVDCADVRIDSSDPHHVVGEIQAKGDNICIGYYKNPEASANAFTEDGYLRTGDLGIMDEEGNIFIRGRSKSMILGPSGQNIYPEEVEAVVNNQPYVTESVVVDRGGKIVALVYLDKNMIEANRLDAEAISDIPENIKVSSNKRLPAYSRIAQVEVRDEPFEKTPKMSIKRFLYK